MISKSLTIGIASALSAMALFGMPAGAASAGEIKVLSVGSLKSSLTELIPSFEKSSGYKVKAEAGAAGEMTNRVQSGEAVDVTIITTAQIEKLITQGKIAAGTQVAIAKSGIGLGARKGATKPDIGSPEAFKRVLSAAKSIGHTDPAGGASSAVYAAQLLARFDNAAELKPKIRTFASNALLFEAVANGEVELGFGQMSEIVAAPGVDLVGPLPALVQHYSQYSAAVPASAKEPDAGKAFINFLVSSPALAVLKAKGIDPP